MNEDSTQDNSVPTDVPAADAPAPAAGSAASEETREVIDAPAADMPQPAPQAPHAPSVGGHDLTVAFQGPVSTPAFVAPTAGASASEVSASEASFAAPGAAFGIPAAPFASESGFNHTAGFNDTVPLNDTVSFNDTVPLTDTAGYNGSVPAGGAPAGPGAAAPQSRGGVKVAGLILAAALVGGAAGFGGSALWGALDTSPVSGPVSGPSTVTVNNPGSVNETTAIAAKVLPSVVTIDVAGSAEAGSGSGVILSSDGYVLTNTHVVTLGGAAAKPAIRVTTSDGRIFDAEIVGTDPIYDLAVIKLKGAEKLTPIDFADSAKINVGDTAVAVGAPLGLSNSVTTGIVSALNRSIEIASSAAPDTATDEETPDPEQTPGTQNPFQFDLPGTGQQQTSSKISIAVIQTDAAINHGNSGGALVDARGDLIGINVAIASSGDTETSGSIGLGFAIPSNIAQRVADEIIENGVATHGLLGASVRDSQSMEDTRVSGALVVEVVPGGAAKAAGLKAEDIVISFNGVPITGASDLTAQVRAAAAGSTATLTYVRDGKSYDIEVELGALGG